MNPRLIMYSLTGNTGLGYEVVKALYASPEPYEIIIGTRTLSKGDDAISQVKAEVPSSSPSSLSTIQVDVTSDASLEAAVAYIDKTHGRLDVLINNAGAGFDTDIHEGNISIRDAFNASWDINVSGAHVLTTLAVPLLLRSADPRLLFVTSGTSSLSETDPDTWGTSKVPVQVLERLGLGPEKGWPKPKTAVPLTTYRSTKTGLNMLMRDWARILSNDGVKVWAISPGFLATGLGNVTGGKEQLRKMGALDPSVGGEFIRDVVQGKRDADAGKIVRSNENQPW